MQVLTKIREPTDGSNCFYGVADSDFDLDSCLSITKDKVRPAIMRVKEVNM